jgi:hypothetical protein
MRRGGDARAAGDEVARVFDAVAHHHFVRRESHRTLEAALYVYRMQARRIGQAVERHALMEAGRDQFIQPVHAVVAAVDNARGRRAQRNPPGQALAQQGAARGVVFFIAQARSRGLMQKPMALEKVEGLGCVEKNRDACIVFHAGQPCALVRSADAAGNSAAAVHRVLAPRNAACSHRVPDLRRDAKQGARRYHRHAVAGAHVQLGVGHRERESDVPVRPDLVMQQHVGGQLKTCEISISPVAGSQEFHRKAGLPERLGFVEKEQSACQSLLCLCWHSCEGIQLCAGVRCDRPPVPPNVPEAKNLQGGTTALW